MEVKPLMKRRIGNSNVRALLCYAHSLEKVVIFAIMRIKTDNRAEHGKRRRNGFILWLYPLF